MTTLRINRAPVLTLWAAIVAERLGSPWETALTLGQAVAGMAAHAKGVRLGIYAQPEERPHEAPPPKPEGATGAVRSLPLLGRNVPVVPTKDGLRAISKGEIAKPESEARYLAGKFGDHFEPARAGVPPVRAFPTRSACRRERVGRQGRARSHEG